MDTPRSLCAVVLAAGLGTRLHPVTADLPKALCRVKGATLLDLALRRVRPFVPSTEDVAVNVHHHRDRIRAHLEGLWPGVHVSVEEDRPLGTAGALGLLRPWTVGRDVLVANVDAWLPPRLPLGPFVAGWSGARPRLAVTFTEAAPDFAPCWRYCGLCLLPAAALDACRPEPGGLYDLVWRPALERGEMELFPVPAAFVDCGTPARLWAANMLASRGETVVEPGARVEGVACRCLVLAGARVARGEVLDAAIRLADGTTLQVG
jgi:NDP-sugar pyrophosphorylase family protein